MTETSSPPEGEEARLALPAGADLVAAGEGVRPVEKAEPLIQLHLASLRSARLRILLPQGEKDTHPFISAIPPVKT